MRRLKLRLFGLVCAGCVNAVKNALEKAGAKVERIDLGGAEIIIEGDDAEKYIDIIRKAGYNADIVKEL